MDAKVKELFAAILGEDLKAIDEQTCPASMPRWDSLQHMILVSSVEEEFGIDIEPEEAVEMYVNFGVFQKTVLQKIADSL